MKQNPKFFLQVDYDLLALTQIKVKGVTYPVTSNHKLVYSYLASLSNSFQSVWPSLAKISKVLGLGTEQVARRLVNDLVKFGWLTKQERVGATHLYTPTDYEQSIIDDTVEAPPIPEEEEEANATPPIEASEPITTDTEDKKPEVIEMPPAPVIKPVQETTATQDDFDDDSDDSKDYDEAPKSITEYCDLLISSEYWDTHDDSPSFETYAASVFKKEQLLVDAALSNKITWQFKNDYPDHHLDFTPF